MPRFAPVFIALLMVRLVAASEPPSDSLQRTFESHVKPFLKTYCYSCHGSELQESKLDLSPFQTAGEVTKEHALWAVVLERLQTKEMPPADAESQPDAAAREQVTQWIRQLRHDEATRN